MLDATTTFYMSYEEIQKLNKGNEAQAYVSSQTVNNLLKVTVPLSWIDGKFMDNSNFNQVNGFILKKSYE